MLALLPAVFSLLFSHYIHEINNTAATANDLKPLRYGIYIIGLSVPILCFGLALFIVDSLSLSDVFDFKLSIFGIGLLFVFLSIGFISFAVLLFVGYIRLRWSS